MTTTRANTLLRQLSHAARDVRGMDVEGDIVLPLRTKVDTQIWGMGSAPLPLSHETQVLMNKFVVEKNGLFHVSWHKGELSLSPVRGDPFSMGITAAACYMDGKTECVDVRASWDADKHSSVIRVCVRHQIKKLALCSEYGQIEIVDPAWCYGGLTAGLSYATVEVPWWWWGRKTEPTRPEMYYYEAVCVS